MYLKCHKYVYTNPSWCVHLSVDTHSYNLHIVSGIRYMTDNYGIKMVVCDPECKIPL